MKKNKGKYPFSDLGVIAMDNCRKLGNKIDKHIIKKRKKIITNKIDKYSITDVKDTYLIKYDNPRFSNGEAKVTLKETVRGKDIYILSDIGNYGCTYEMYGITTHMGPDEHFQDIKRTISAIKGNARRVTVIMPLLYASRQHKRKGRESLDCSMALQELKALGVENIVTFDAHDPRVENAVPSRFENLYPTYDIIKEMLKRIDDLKRESTNMLVISPDTGAMDRAIFYASALGLEVGMFYKKRDHSKIVNGRNPIVRHEYMGKKIEGMNVLIVDDMISSGESILDLAYELKKRKANKIYVAATFALFTEGINKICNCYEEDIINKIFATNLTYIPEEIIKSDWFSMVDMSGFLSILINRLNYDQAISPLFRAEDKIECLLDK